MSLSLTLRRTLILEVIHTFYYIVVILMLGVGRCGYWLKLFVVFSGVEDKMEES